MPKFLRFYCIQASYCRLQNPNQTSLEEICLFFDDHEQIDTVTLQSIEEIHLYEKKTTQLFRYWSFIIIELIL